MRAIKTAVFGLTLLGAVAATALIKGTSEHRKAFRELEKLADIDGKNGTSQEEMEEVFKVLRDLGYEDLQYDHNVPLEYVLNLSHMDSYVTYRKATDLLKGPKQ
jgi:antitoxin component HigA of HigAB toxin-antitoxin module